MQNMKLTKTLKTENKQNTEQILQCFTERWDKAEKLTRGQSQENEVPIPKEAPAHSLVLTFTVESSGFSRDNPHGRSLFSRDIERSPQIELVNPCYCPDYIMM